MADHKVETTYEPTSFVLKFDSDINSNDFVLSQVPWGRHVSQVVYIGNINGSPKIAILPTKNVEVKENQNLAGEPLDDLHFKGINVETLTQFDVKSRRYG